MGGGGGGVGGGGVNFDIPKSFVYWLFLNSIDYVLFQWQKLSENCCQIVSQENTCARSVYINTKEIW